MTRRIGAWIRAGEIDNSTSNSVHGWLHFWGQRHPTLLHLTGNAGRGLRGRKVRFRSPHAEPEASHRKLRLQAQQIGPVGRMRLTACEATQEEAWQMRLLLEWYSQDGHIVLEIGAPLIEFILRPHAPSVAHRDAFSNLLSVDCEELRFQVWPQDLSAARRVAADEDEPYWRMLDDVVTGERDVPLCSLFDPPLRLRPADQMDDRELLRGLRRLLARLAKHGIAIDICPHYRLRDTYIWLVEEVLPREMVFPDLPRLGYVMHYLTSERCSECR